MNEHALAIVQSHLPYDEGFTAHCLCGETFWSDFREVALKRHARHEAEKEVEESAV